ncbi:MAG: histidine kinase dimerization/phospho-acceptor domain-containing protein, partial [Myxococcota bacterium]
GWQNPGSKDLGAGPDSHPGGQRVTEHKEAEAPILALGRITRSVAHDFNNALTSILSSAELLREDTPPEDPRSTDIDRIRRACLRARALTVQLLDITDHREHAPEVFALVPRIESRRALIEKALGSDVPFSLSGDNSIHALLDPSGFDRCMLQLAVNASTIGGDAASLGIRVAQEGEACVVIAESTGVLEEHELDHVFDPSISQRCSLAQVYRFAKVSGGTARIETVDERTRVRLEFPALADDRGI